MNNGIDRRNFLKQSLVAGGAALAWSSYEEKVLSAEAAPNAKSAAATNGRVY